MNLITRLLVLVCIAIAPAVAIQAYNILKLRKDLEGQVHRTATQFAIDAASEIDAILRSAQVLLGTLAASPAVARGSPEDCSAQLASVERDFPEYTRIAVIDAEGTIGCASSPSLQRSVEVVERQHVREAFARNGFAVGRYAIGATSGRPVLPIALAMHAPGATPRAVVAGIDLAWLSERLHARATPEGGSITVADAEATILARYPLPDRFIGTRIPEGFHHLLTAPAAGALEVQSQDGTRRMLGYVPIGRSASGLYVSAGVSTQEAFAAIDAAIRDGLLMVAIGSALAIGAALAGGHAFIRRPVGALLAATRRWRDGDYGARAPVFGTGEIHDLGRAFNEMAEAVERRDDALRESERRLLQRERDFSRLLVSSSPDGVLGYDPELRVTVWNPALERGSGMGEAQVVGRDFFSVFPSARGTALDDAMRAAVAGQPRELPNLPYPPETGRQGSVEMKLFPVYDGPGAVVGGIAFIRDTTERERLGERLREAQRLEAIGRLTGGVAHDFNNLLQALVGCLRLVRRRSSEPAVAPLVEMGLQTIERGAKLTQHLLAFARRQDLRPEPADLRARLLGMADLLARALREDIRTEFDLEQGLWPVEIDATQFELAILNLAVNARDAMPNGGMLRIRAANADGSAVQDEFPGVDPAGSFVRIAVADTGEGMPAEVAARAFEPFFTTKKAGRGSGLGLSQVYGFVRQSGGQIRIASQPGRGAEVVLLLPRCAAQPRTARTLPRQERSGTGAHILMVEDDEAVAAMLEEALGELGYAVVRAGSPADALEILSQGRPVDLLLTDVVMPGGMNGVDLAREARRMRAGLPVLLVTGYSDGLAAGTEFRVVAKPVRIEDLQDAIEAELHESVREHRSVG